MVSVSVEITDALSFLDKTLPELEDLHDDVVIMVDYIKSQKPIHTDPSGFGEYEGALREKVKKYKKDTTDTLECISADFKMFAVDMREIISNKENPEVLRNVSKFMRHFDHYKEFKKKGLSNYLETSHRQLREYLNKDHVVLYSDLIRVLSVEEAVVRCTEQIIKKLDHFLNGKKEED